jgi:hypothetical protein
MTIERSTTLGRWSELMLAAWLLSSPFVATPSHAAPKESTLAATDAALVGHYYLSGVTEVGSELLLKPDGTFEWMLAYGAVDQAARGTWKRDGLKVILAANKGDQSAPIFTLGPLDAWNKDAEQRLQDMIFKEKQAKIEELCPFLLVDDVTSALTAPSVTDAEKAARRLRATSAIPAAVAKVETKRRLAARAAEMAMVAKSDRVQLMDSATEAMIDWKAARGQMLDLYSAAGLKEPDRLEPNLPAACNLPAKAIVDEKAPNSWRQGFAVRVHDSIARMFFSNIKVTYTFIDGEIIERLTNQSGLAILQYRPGKSVQRLTLTVQNEGEPIAETFKIAPTASGIQYVNINSRAIAAPPFETLVLKIDGLDLVAAQMHNGHYVRQ